MRNGWAGDAPSSEEQAIDRILDAADALTIERGSSMRISDVARELGVTRQTVYRYFPSTEALFLAAALRSADGFLEHLASAVKGITDPVSAMVESMAYCIESLGNEDRILAVLSPRSGVRGTSLASDTAVRFGRAMLHRFDVDWSEHGYDEAALDELAEFGLRVLHSFLTDPIESLRNPDDLREFLARWLGPAVAYPLLRKAVSGIHYVGVDASARPRCVTVRPVAE